MRVNDEARNRRIRAQLARRAMETLAPDAPLLAPRLARHAQAEALTWNELAASLGATPDGLNHIALCRPPRPEFFAADVEAIARNYAAPDRLLNLLRRLQALEAFADRAAETSAPYTADPAGGMLLAARDREEEEKQEKIREEDKTDQEQRAIENPEEQTP